MFRGEGVNRNIQLEENLTRKKECREIISYLTRWDLPSKIVVVLWRDNCREKGISTIKQLWQEPFLETHSIKVT